MSSFRTLNKNAGQNTNPATKFLNWKSNDKCFAYYDKELSQNIEIKLPFKFKFLEHFHCVKGWHDATEKGIYSNEVMLTGSENLKVKTFGGLEIADGLYKDIRSKVRDAGGKYHRSLYALNDKGEIINISMKGAVVSAYSNFLNGDPKLKTKGNSYLIENNWIEINTFEELKKGATKYSVPVFTIGKPYTTEEYKNVVDKYEVIKKYYEVYSGKAIPTVEVDAPEDIANDDLDY